MHILVKETPKPFLGVSLLSTHIHIRDSDIMMNQATRAVPLST